MAEAGAQHHRPLDTARDSEKDRLIAELRAALRSRDEFVAIAAHELRNPMTPVLMQVTSLVSAARDPRRCRPELLAPRLEVLEHAVRDFVRRATALLDVSRIAAGNIQIEPVPIDLGVLVGQAVDRARVPARVARCPIETDLPPGIIGHWDPLALDQVTDNLLSNAIKFGAGQPVRVTVAADAAMVRLTVGDGGVGIAEADRARVFGRFERVVGQREHGGFGIGLWLANRLITAMGGSIEIGDSPGQGTTFTVILPAGDGRSGNPMPCAADGSGPDRPPPRTTGRTRAHPAKAARPRAAHRPRKAMSHERA